jgi:hypothetical protein
VLAEEMLVEASLLEPVDGLAGIREADDVGEPAAQRGRGVAERAAVDQMLHRMDLRHVLELTHVATKVPSDAALACPARRFALTQAVLSIDLSRSAVSALPYSIAVSG